MAAAARARADELVEHFGLGFANRTLGLRLQELGHAPQHRLRSRLQELGVFRQSGHEQLRGCIVVLLRDEAGRVVDLYGRKIGLGLPGETKRDLWLRDDRPGVLTFDAVAGEEVIVTATTLDALRLSASGRRNVTALHGLDGPVDALGRAVVRHEPRRVLVVLPPTDEGDRAAEHIMAKLANAIAKEVRHVRVPSKPSPERFAAAVDAAIDALPTTPAVSIAPTKTDEHTDAPLTEPRIVASESGDDETVLQFGDRRWRIRGLQANRARGTLRVQVFVTREDVGFHVDVLDVCVARQRSAFVRLAAVELCMEEVVVKKDMGQVLLALELAQSDLLRRGLHPEPAVPAMTDAERDAALELLRDPGLLDRVLADLERLGVVGERTNLLVAYLATISRKLPAPLGVVVQSSPAAGKSSLLQAVLSLVPEEDRVVYSMMTGQSLYYMGNTDLRHKVLAIAEDRGIARASYALKLLQSDGALEIASTGKESSSGRLVSQRYRVEGPVAIMLTTTAVDLDEELLSRCLVLAADESPEQTRKIHVRQRWLQTLEGLQARQAHAAIVALHGNAQRLLRPLPVVNPHATSLAYADLRVRARRDHRKLLGLVEAVALLHQHQRPLVTLPDGVTEAVAVQPADIDLASRLLAEVTPGLDDLPTQTLRLLDAFGGVVDERARELGIHRDHVRLSRRQLRERLAVGDTQLKVHLRRLVEAELVLVHRAAHGSGVVYSLAFDGTDTSTYDDTRSASGRRSVGPRSGGGRGSVGPASPTKNASVEQACIDAGGHRPKKRTSRAHAKPPTVDVPATKEVG